MTNETDSLRLINDRAVAELLGVSRRTIWRWAATVDDFPQPARLAEGVTRWRLADIDAWVNRRAGVTAT